MASNASNTYTISYNKNAGTDTVTNLPTSQTKTHGTALTLSSLIPKRAGYAFKGWGTSSTATAVTYPPGSSYTANAGATLYAVWEKITFQAGDKINFGGESWIVLDPDAIADDTDNTPGILMLSEYILENRAWNNAIYDTNSTYLERWELSSIRSYLRTGFENSISMSNAEKSAVLRAKKEANGQAEWATLGLTGDRFFLLNRYDIHNGAMAIMDTLRIGYNKNGQATSWWTRSSYTRLSARFVSTSGDALNSTDASVTQDLGLRPAFYLDPDAVVGVTTGNDGTKTLTLEDPTPYTITKGTATPTAGGSFTVGATSATAGTQVSITASPATGYELSAITAAPTTSGSGTAVEGTVTGEAAGSFIMPGFDVTVNVTFKLKTYAVTYNKNTEDTVSGMPAEQTKTHGTSLTLASNRPVREGYDFLGWATDASATTATYQPSASYTANAALSLFAVWKRSEVNIDLTLPLDLGGGEVTAIEPNPAVIGEPVTLTIQPEEGKRLVSVAVTDKNGTEVTPVTVDRENNTATFNMPEAGIGSVTATFEDIIYTVTEGAMDATKGTFSAMPKTATKGATVTITIDTASGYEVTSVTAETAGGTSLTVSGTGSQRTFEMPADNVTVNVVFARKTYTVSYNANGGSGAPAAQTKTHGEPLFLSETEPVRADYTFKGWGLDENATTAVYQPGGQYVNNSSQELFAIWQKTKVDIDLQLPLELDGGKVTGIQPDPAVIGEPVTLTIQPEEGKRLVSVDVTDKNGTAVTPVTVDSENNTATFNMPEAGIGTVTATFEDIMYTITPGAMDTAKGIFEVDKGTAGVGAAVTVTVSPAPGHTLDAITVVPESGTAPTVTVEGNVGTFPMVASNVTVNVTFKLMTYTVEFNKNTTDVVAPMPTSQTKTYGVALSIPDVTPARNGYQFKGWGTAADATTAVYQPGGQYVQNANRTLYAIWEKNPVNIELELPFDLGNGQVTHIDPNPAVPGKDVTITIQPEEGKKVETVTVTSTNGTNVTPITNNGDNTFTFKMPEDGIGDIEATFSDIVYTVTVAEPTNGTATFTANADPIVKGTEITVTATPAEGLTLDTITVTPAGGGEGPTVAITGNTGKFTMPAANVTVTVKFKAGTANLDDTLTDNTGGKTDITGKDNGDGTTTITLKPKDENDKWPRVIVKDNGDGTYERLTPVDNGDGTYSVTLGKDDKFIVNLKGDVNCDGIIDIFDFSTIAGHLSGAPEQKMTPLQEVIADVVGLGVNPDGLVDATDYFAVTRIWRDPTYRAGISWN